MKKSYEKPVIARRETLGQVAAMPPTSGPIE